MKKLLLFGFLLLQSLTAWAIDLSVGQGRVAAKPIAVVPFAGNTEANRVDFIISADLKKSGVFLPISPNSYQERPHSDSQINYMTFQALGAAYIVTGKVVAGQEIVFSIADAFQQQSLGTYRVRFNGKTLRQTAHEVSDLILEKLTGVRGAFATRLVYIHEKGQGAARRYQVVISDSDGFAPIVLLNSLAPVMSPRFSPNGRKIAYVTFEGGQSQIVTHDIMTGIRHLVSKAEGINSSPAWSPDGSKIAMVLSKDGNPEIYYKDMMTGALMRVTNHRSIDTEPTWSPDGKKIYFTSDRSGDPQLYQIALSNGAVSKVTSAGRYSAGADVSSDNNYIALARKTADGFAIGTIDRNTGQFKVVSHSSDDETPRFSPNGKMLIFTSVTGNKAVLKVVNVDGTGTNTLSTSGQIRDPDWSTYLR